MDVLRRAICRRYRFWARNTASIDTYPPHLGGLRFGQIGSKDISQALFVNATIFKRLIQARPLALKPQRLRDFGKRLGLGFGYQGINRIEQSVLRPQKTVIDVVTKLFQCGTVFQTSTLPLVCDDGNFTR